LLRGAAERRYAVVVLLALATLLATVGATDAPLAGGDVTLIVDDEECAPPQPGFLTVDTQPWTVVYVDGAYAGSTPMFRHALAPGAHTLTFVNEKAGVLVQEDVVVEEGRARKLKLVLAHVSADTTLDASTTAQTSADDCFLPADVAASLSVDTQPWSQVFVDGKRVGSTPVFREPVTAGDHVVRLVTSEGKQAFARFTADVGENVKLALVLTPRDPVD
jgi:hypothetical protein